MRVPAEFSGEQLDFSLLDDNTKAAFADILSDPAIANIGEDGIGIPVSGILNFFKARMVDFGVGTFLMHSSSNAPNL